MTSHFYCLATYCVRVMFVKKGVQSKFLGGGGGVVDGEGGSSEGCLKWGGGVIKGSFQKRLKTGGG